MPGFKVTGITDPVGGMDTISSDFRGVSSRADYYYSYTWEIFRIFDNFIGSASDPLIHLRDCVLPTFTVNQDSYLASSLEYKWAKGVTWDDVKVTWYDSSGLINIMRAWRKTIWTAMEGLKVASEYKRPSQINVFLPDGSAMVCWCLIGSWPKVIRQGEMTYTNSEAKIVEVTVAYDWAEEQKCGEVNINSSDSSSSDDGKWWTTTPPKPTPKPTPAPTPTTKTGPVPPFDGFSGGRSGGAGASGGWSPSSTGVGVSALWRP